jgi:ribosomal-protein-alanine N-acetyltransferase
MSVSIVTLNGASAAEAKLLSDLHKACFDDGWSAGAVGRIVAMPGAVAQLARTGRGDPPIGFVVWRTAADEAEIITLGVLPAFRRRGIGAQLMAAAEATAAAAGALRLFLEVAVDNTAALALYRTRGYSDVGGRSGYYRDGGGRRRDAIIMARHLGVSPRGELGDRGTDRGNDSPV